MKFLNFHDAPIIIVMAFVGVWLINHALRSVGMSGYTV